MLLYDRNIVGSSPEIPVCFGNLRKMFENVRLAFGTSLENHWKPSENGLKFSEIVENVVISMFIY